MISQDYKETFKTGPGARVLKHMFTKYGLYAPVFSENRDRMCFNEGQRNVVLDILRYLHLNEEEINVILKANDERGSGL